MDLTKDKGKDTGIRGGKGEILGGLVGYMRNISYLKV